MSQADYDRTPKSPLQHNHSAGPNTAGNMPFKPVPPPKPKNYRPISNMTNNGNMPPNQWDAPVCICPFEFNQHDSIHNYNKMSLKTNIDAMNMIGNIKNMYISNLIENFIFYLH